MTDIHIEWHNGRPYVWGEARSTTPAPNGRRYSPGSYEDRCVMWIYRWYDESDVLLYVGITKNPEQRVNNHRSTAVWWPWAARFAVDPHHAIGMVAAEIREADVVRREHPIFNINWATDDKSRAMQYMASTPVHAPAAPTFPPGLKQSWSVWLTQEERAEIEAMANIGRVNKSVQIRAILRTAVTQYLDQARADARGTDISTEAHRVCGDAMDAEGVGPRPLPPDDEDDAEPPECPTCGHAEHHIPGIGCLAIVCGADWFCACQET